MPTRWRLDDLDRRILVIAVPALGSLLVEPIYVLTDTAVVGRIGTTSLGGLALATTVLNTLVWVFNFLSYGTTVRVAVRRGRGDPAAIAEGATYLRISAVGVPFQFVVIACIGYLYGLPDTKRPFIVLAISISANLALELLLVLGLDWGIAGSAWGTVVAQSLSAILFLWIVIPRRLRPPRARPRHGLARHAAVDQRAGAQEPPAGPGRRLAGRSRRRAVAPKVVVVVPVTPPG